MMKKAFNEAEHIKSIRILLVLGLTCYVGMMIGVFVRSMFGQMESVFACVIIFIGGFMLSIIMTEKRRKNDNRR